MKSNARQCRKIGATLTLFAYHLPAMKKLAFATLLLATAAIAQQTHNQYEPPNPPGAGQKLLAQFAGDWDVVKTVLPMNGKPIVSKGTCKQYMIQGRQISAVGFHLLHC